MSKCDEADVVPSWSTVVPETDLKNFGSCTLAAECTRLTLKDFPGTSLRPMTLEEIQAYRKTDE